VLERLDYHSEFDERNPRVTSKTLDSMEDYPYPKTYSGAIQLKKCHMNMRLIQISGLDGLC